MTNATHTPAPWFVGAITSNGHNIQVRAKKVGTDFECCPAILGGWDTTKEENLANARLIAAAPELLEALESFINQHQDTSFEAQHKRIDVARAAIAKAKVGV